MMLTNTVQIGTDQFPNLSKGAMRRPSCFLIAFIGFASAHFSAGAVLAVEIGTASNVVPVGYLCGLARHLPLRQSTGGAKVTVSPTR
jgi:hypothetical protein